MIRSIYSKTKDYFRTSPCISPFMAMAAVLPCLIALLIFSLFPALLNVGISFTDYRGTLNVPFKFVGFDNYMNFWQINGKEAITSLVTTLKFAFGVIIIQQPLAVIMALLVNRGFKSSNFFRAVFFMPNILGVVVVGFMFNMVFDPYSGPAASLLKLFDRTSAFFGDPDIALGLVVLVTVWNCFGFAMVIYLAGMQSIDNSYYEASCIDGASRLKQFFYITVPLLRPAVTINLWIAISGTLGMFDIMFILTNGGPGDATRTFSLYFFQQVQMVSINQGQVAAMSIYFVVFITTIMLTFNYFMRRKEVEL